MPLGSGALAGSAFALDREFMARELGFSGVTPNSLDAVSDRDFLLEALAALSILMMHLSRYCEDLVLFSSAEFGFVELDDAWATGSSMMPQKKNPDSLELVRGKTGRVYGDLVTLLTAMKGLGLTYGKDLQEDKEPVFDAFDTASDCLEVFASAWETMKVNAGRMASGRRRRRPWPPSWPTSSWRRGCPSGRRTGRWGPSPVRRPTGDAGSPT